MNRSVSMPIALLCALTFFTVFAFFGCGGDRPQGNGIVAAGPTPTPVDCSKSPTSDEMENAVYGMLKANGYEEQFWRFTIAADPQNKMVTIIGWSPDRGQIIGGAQSAMTKCTGGNGKGVDDTHFKSSQADFDSSGPISRPGGSPYPPMRVGCPPNYLACGDICIPAGDPCKVLAGVGAGPNTPGVTCTAPSAGPGPKTTPDKSGGSTPKKP